MNYMKKIEDFAGKIVLLAAEEELTICEFAKAIDMAKGISVNSMVEKGSIERTDFPSDHIID